MLDKRRLFIGIDDQQAFVYFVANVRGPLMVRSFSGGCAFKDWVVYGRAVK